MDTPHHPWPARRKERTTRFPKGRDASHSERSPPGNGRRGFSLCGGRPSFERLPVWHRAGSNTARPPLLLLTDGLADGVRDGGAGLFLIGEAHYLFRRVHVHVDPTGVDLDA